MRIAVAEGDGIGPEIMAAVLRLFREAGLPLELVPVEMGMRAYQAGHSTGMTEEARRIVEDVGILFKGPMETPKGGGLKSVNVTARKLWSTYANKRIFKTLPGVDTVFSRAGIPIDLTFVRENIEDTYGGIEHMQTHDVAQCRRMISRPGSLQVHRYAFEVAKRKGARKITCAHKANIMKMTDGLFLEAFREVAADYPELEAEDLIVDDLAMKLVTRPDRFEVIVLPNLQGDILSDLAAGLVGGLGFAPSANVGEHVAIFEAVHGTAPDLAGKGIANPTALLLSGCILLRHLGFFDHAAWIEGALHEALWDGCRTADVAGRKPPLSTEEFVDAILVRMRRRDAPAPGPLDRVLYVPPVRPRTQPVLETPKRVEETVVGMDVFVESHVPPNELAAKVQLALPPDVRLVMISNRGTQVWPTASIFTECVNHFRLRVVASKERAISVDRLLEVAQLLGPVARICSLEMLITLGDKAGFSLAQGQASGPVVAAVA
ncbi:MAG: isocitrate/isopropylmalate family dehydrogenase [Polyangiales bacterium]